MSIESDVSAVKGQKEFAMNQRKRNSFGRSFGRNAVTKKRKTSSLTGVPPDESFIGVEINSRGFVERIYLDDEVV